jgi:TolB-like protein/Tfp pilus assembly protein PilF
VESGGDISGDAVNVASRVESLADSDGVCITRQVYDHVHNKVEMKLVSLGQRQLKHVEAPVEVFKVDMPWDSKAPLVSPPPPKNRIAILPFTNMSPDPNDSFFADGMTEEIISTVSSVSGLSVISRTSVTGYKATTKHVREIGRELEVGSILEGSLRKAGNKIRITTQLIDVGNDSHLWSQSYDRELDDIFSVQTDIAKQVAEALRIRILSPEMERISKKPTESTAAYTLYLRGRQLWNTRDPDQVKEAIALFSRAVEEDPNFALGYVGLADSYEILVANYGLDRDANDRKAKEMARRALELDPELAEAHASNGLILNNDLEFRAAEEEFKIAIRLKPSYAPVHMWYSSLLVAQQKWDEGKREIEKATELDPLSQIIRLNHAFYYWARRDYPTAFELLHKTLELNPDFPPAHFGLGNLHGILHRIDDARREINEAVRIVGERAPEVQADVRLAADLGLASFAKDKDTVLRLLPQAISTVGKPFAVTPLDIAFAYFGIGMNGEGFEWTERAYAQKDHTLELIKNIEVFDAIRSDLRYEALVQKLGL